MTGRWFSRRAAWHRPAALVAAIVHGGSYAVDRQVPRNDYYLAIRSGVRCHTGPGDDFPTAARYYVGDVIGVTKTAPGAAGSVWYFDSWRVSGSSPSCWINGRFTAPYDRRNREAAYLAIADSLLSRRDSVAFDEYVDVLNLLESAGNEQPERGPGVLGPRDTALFERYPRLRYERLLIIERALERLRTTRVADHPLVRAWIAAHGDVLQYFEPGMLWEAPARAYWSIFDAHRAESWAEPVAWTAAQHLGDSDECDAGCFLSMLSHGPEGYWNRLPHGPHVNDALALATRLAKNALDAVAEGRPNRSTVASIRASLEQVSAPGKGKLLEVLQQLER